MARKLAAFYAPQRALEALASALSIAGPALAPDAQRAPGILACTESLHHLPPRRPGSVLLHPSEPSRSVQWASCVGRYASFLSRLYATEEAYCNARDSDLATIPYAPPADTKAIRIVLPCTKRQLETRPAADVTAVHDVDSGSLIAALPALELRSHDGSTVWAPKAIVRLGVRALQVSWMAAAQGRDASRLSSGVREIFSAFWGWTRRPPEVTDEQHAAKILALAHRVASEAHLVFAHPAAGLPRYPVFLREGAQRFMALGAHIVSDLLDGPLRDVDAKLGAAYGLRAVPADEAPDGSLDHRIAFFDRLPTPPNDPVVIRLSGPVDAQPIRRGTRYVRLEEVPPHLAKVRELDNARQLRPYRSARAWFHAVERASECALLEQRGQIAVDERHRVRHEVGEAFADLAGELWEAGERQRSIQLAKYMEHFFGVHLVPPLPAATDGELRLRRGDRLSQDAIDWECSELVPGDADTRGSVKAVVRFGARDEQGVIRRAHLRLAMGPPPAATRLGDELGRMVAKLDWSTLDPEEIAGAAQRVDEAAHRCDAELFQDRARELELLQGWLRELERNVAGDPERAHRVSRVQISLLQRAAHLGAPLSPFLTATRLGNVTIDPSVVEIRHQYRDDTVPLAILGILRTGLLEDGRRPHILVSRGSTVPQWTAPLRTAARLVPTEIADLGAEFEQAWNREPSFELPGWRAMFLCRILSAAAGSKGTSRAILDAMHQTLAASEDMVRFLLVPPIGAGDAGYAFEPSQRGPEFDAGVTHWFTPDTPMDQIVSVERPGLFERLVDGTGRWHLPPRITMSAGRHNGFTRQVQPVLERCMQWLELAPFAPAKRYKYVDLMKRRVLSHFRELAAAALEPHEARGGVARMLCATRGVIAFLCHAGCGDVAILDAVCALALEAQVPLAPLSGAAFGHPPQSGQPAIPVLLASAGSESEPGRVFRGAMVRPAASVAGVALELVSCLAGRDDVDSEAREARVVADTLWSLADGTGNVEAAAIFLATKVHALLPSMDPDPAGVGGNRAIEALHAGVERALTPLGLSLSPIRIGEDVREYDGRYKARPGSVNWRVTQVQRPCLMKNGLVVQHGIVETD